jgi:glycerol-3-phosphate dehydrogenase (NAD(P)+)
VIVSATKGLEAGTHAAHVEVIAQEAGGRIRSWCSRGRASPRKSRAAADRDSRRVASAAAIELVQRNSAARTSVSTAATMSSASKSAGDEEHHRDCRRRRRRARAGHNALAALITRGLAELTRLACAAGGRRETLAGSERAWRSRPDVHRKSQPKSTCRDRTGARACAAGDSRGMKMVAEGIVTTGAALALGERYGVELPITTQMAEVLEGRADVRTALDALMLRRQRSEAETG